MYKCTKTTAIRKGIFTIILALLTYYASAQCVGNPNIGNGLYPSGDSLPCALVGQAYNFTFQFRNFDSLTFAFFINIDSVRIDSITISGGWSSISFFTDKTNNRFMPGENGCISFSGIAPSFPSRDHLQIHASIFIDTTSYQGVLEGFIIPASFGGQSYDSIAPIYINTIGSGSLCQSSHINRSNYVKGKIYYDIDGNGNFGPSDYAMPNKPVILQPGNGTFYTNVSGIYYAFTDTGSYNIALTSPTNYAISSSPLSYAVNLPNIGDSAVGLDFGLIPTDTIYDLSIVATASPTRPGFYSTHWLVYENRGTMPIPSGTVTYTLDTNYTFNVATPNNNLVAGNTYTWNFTDLLPTEQRTIAVSLYLPPNIDLMGDTLISIGNIAPADADDNSFINEVVVTASYDPNDKTPYPTEKLDEAFIDSGEPLMYRIRFQNTGTDTAFNITVRDTLDLDKFNPSSIRLIGASHEYTFRIEQNNIAIWEFANILLPDSNVNEPGSHGFILLELDLLPGLTDGDVVENRAGIYFDFNPVVLTDYAISRVDFSSGINELVGNSQITIYPNPAQNQLIVYQEQWQMGSSIKLFDLSGKLMVTETLTAQRTELNTTSLPNGI
jgi:uncharacterized repeat protein (TIGR01451 family)